MRYYDFELTYNPAGATVQAHVIRNGAAYGTQTALNEIAGFYYANWDEPLKAGDVIRYYDVGETAYVDSEDYLPETYQGDTGAIVGGEYIGDYSSGDTVYFLFKTADTAGEDGSLQVFKNGVEAGAPLPGAMITYNVDANNTHLCIIPLYGDNFWAIERDYAVVLTGETVGADTFSGIIALFSIENRHEMNGYRYQ